MRQLISVRILPVRGGKFLCGHGLAGGGTDQADPGLDPAVLEHPRRRGQNNGGALRAGVDDGPPVAQGEGIAGRQRHEPVAADDLDKLGGGARGFMNVNRLARGDAERVGADGLDALLVGPGLDGLFDVGLDAGFQLGEQLVLLGDGQGQQAVEEPGHRRQVFLE